MYCVATYCILIAVSFISVAYALLKRVIKTSHLSGVTTDKSVCRRLLGSGIILSSSYFIQGIIIYLLVSTDRSVFLSNIRWVAMIFKCCIIMIMLNTLLLYSKIIQQRLKNHWRKWAKSNKIWDLNTSTKKRKKKRVHHRVDTEEIAFDPADIRLIRALSSGSNLHATLLSQGSHTANDISHINYTDFNRKVTQKYDKPPLNARSTINTEELDNISSFPISHSTLNDTNGWNSINNMNDIIEINDEKQSNNNDCDMEDADTMIGFDTMDQLFDEFIMNSDEESNDMNGFDIDNSHIMIDVIENENINDESQPIIHEDIETDNSPNMSYLEAPPSKNYTNMSAEKEVMENEMRDDEILIDIFENGINYQNSPSQLSKSVNSPKTIIKLNTPEQMLIDGVNTFHFPMAQHSVSTTVTNANNNYNETQMTPIHEFKTVTQFTPKKASGSNNDSKSNSVSTNQSPAHLSTKLEPLTPFAQMAIMQNMAINNALDNSPPKLSLTSNKQGMFKSKSMQNTSKNSLKKTDFKPKTKTFDVNASFDENDALVGDQFTDSEISQTPKRKTMKKHKKSEEYSYLSQPTHLNNILFSLNTDFNNSESHSDSDDNLLSDMSSVMNTSADEDMQFENAFHTLNSPKSHIVQKKRTVPTNQKNDIKTGARNRTRSASTTHYKKQKKNIIEINYKNRKHYKNIEKDSDIISHSHSNPRFWKYLKKQHAKKINMKALKKFTFSFQKARYEAILARESSPITPCSSPRYFGRNFKSKKSNSREILGTSKMSNLGLEQPANNTANQMTHHSHIRSSSDQSLNNNNIFLDAAQQNLFLETIEASPQSKSQSPDTLQVIQHESKNADADSDSNVNTSKIKSKNKFGFSLSRSPTKTKSPFNFSSPRSKTQSKSTTPQPQTVNMKKKDLLSFSKPLTPFALSSKFKKAQKTFFGSHNSHKSDISNSEINIADSPKMRQEYHRLNRKRKNLKHLSERNKLDISGVAAKLDYWKANELKNDKRWKILQKKRQRIHKHQMSAKTPKTPKISSDNIKRLKGRNHLKLANFASDPINREKIKMKNENENETDNKMQAKWKNMFVRFGNVNEMKQHHTLHAQKSEYISGSFDMKKQWSSHSSDSDSNSNSSYSSSLSGKYSNSNENNNNNETIYSYHDKKHKKRKRTHRKCNGNKPKLLSENCEILNPVRYCKTPMFGTDATDSEHSDIEHKSNKLNNISSLTSFKKLKTIQTANSVKYIRTKSFTPRTPKTPKTAIIEMEKINNQSICEWQTMDVCCYIMQLFPEFECYKNNILKSKILGNEFICMQNINEFKNRFNIRNETHIHMLLNITHTLLMAYHGNNKHVLNIKAKQNEKKTEIES